MVDVVAKSSGRDQFPRLELSERVREIINRVIAVRRIGRSSIDGRYRSDREMHREASMYMEVIAVPRERAKLQERDQRGKVVAVGVQSDSSGETIWSY